MGRTRVSLSGLKQHYTMAKNTILINISLGEKNNLWDVKQLCVNVLPSVFCTKIIGMPEQAVGGSPKFKD